MSTVFLSYSARDREITTKLANDLKALGHTVWLDEWDIRVGESIPLRIEQGLSGSDYLIVALSKHSVESTWVQREWSAKYWEEAESGRVLVLPVLLEDCTIPPLLKTKKYADFRANYSLGLVHLTAAISPVIGDVGKPQLPNLRATEYRDITNLISKVNNPSSSLAECVADALNVAQARGDTDFVSFCKRELTGFVGLTRDDLQRLEPNYRLIEIVVSPTAKLNLQYLGWGGSPSRLFEYAKQDKNFFLWKTFVQYSVARLEHLVATTPPTSIITLEMPLSHLMPDTDTPDAPVFGYSDPRSYATIIEGIRQQLLQRLFKLLPG